MFIATLIAAEELESGDVSAAEDRLAEAGGYPMGRSWVEAGKACDLLFGAAPQAVRIALEGELGRVDVVVQGESGRRKRLLVADMDSTIIGVECIDELAGYAGIKDQVAEITERAMQGELDFASALRARVKLLQGLEAAVIDRCREERVWVRPGAETLVRTMRREGAYCLLVSGGFTLFAEPIAEAVGFHRAIANRLVIEGTKLSGAVEDPIVGAETKLQALTDAAAEHDLELADALGIGDGANDIPMVSSAGLGVAFHPKPALAEAASARVDHNDLDALLYAQGYARAQWEKT